MELISDISYILEVNDEGKRKGMKETGRGEKKKKKDETELISAKQAVDQKKLSKLFSQRYAICMCH